MHTMKKPPKNKISLLMQDMMLNSQIGLQDKENPTTFMVMLLVLRFGSCEKKEEILTLHLSSHLTFPVWKWIL